VAPKRDKLSTYRAKRDFDRTSEPSDERRATSAAGAAGGGRFVIQEHHARRLHWDFRLERDGVLVSWALPRGVPADPDRNRLAVHTEDHPLEYLEFAGDIPKGEYGGGSVAIWDRGTYEAEKWEDSKVTVVLHGDRVSGRYALFRTRGDDWMIHRMDPPVPGEPLPERIEPMLAGEGKRLPTKDEEWGFEIGWHGERVVALCDTGHVALQRSGGEDLRPLFPELFALALELEGEPAALDGVVAVLGDDGASSPERLERRLGAGSDSEIRRRARDTPATLIVFDLLHHGRESLLGLPYSDRRDRLESLDLEGPNWQTPAYHRGDGKAFRAAAAERGVSAIVAKRLESPYRPGTVSRDWRRLAT
jgi:bifunctional non-homologous end joining protein LigD